MVNQQNCDSVIASQDVVPKGLCLFIKHYP